MVGYLVRLRIYYKFAAKSVRERIWCIGQNLAKLEARMIIVASFFPDTVYNADIKPRRSILRDRLLAALLAETAIVHTP